VTPAEMTEELVLEEMLASCERGHSHDEYTRWERAWSLCAGAYKREARPSDAKRCEDNIVTLRAFRRAAGLAEEPS
jgi:hypothetical protein